MQTVLRGQLLRDGHHSVCRKYEHGQDQPKPAKARKFFEKYLGKMYSFIADANLSFAVNFNYQVFSINLQTTYSELGIEVDTSTVMDIPEIPEHSFNLIQWLWIGSTNHLIFFDRAGAGGGSTTKYLVLAWTLLHLSLISKIYLTSALSTFPSLILITLFHHYPSMWGVPMYTCYWE